MAKKRKRRQLPRNLVITATRIVLTEAEAREWRSLMAAGPPDNVHLTGSLIVVVPDDQIANELRDALGISDV